MVLLNSTKLGVKFQLRFERILPELPYKPMQNQYASISENVDTIQIIMNVVTFPAKNW